MSSIVPIPAVNASIFNEKNEILLTRRSSRLRAAGQWVLPGGRVDRAESWAGAMVREVQEEVGLEVLDFSLMGIYSDPELTVSDDIFPEGYRAQFVVAVFKVLSFRGAVTPNWEVDAWGWFAEGDFPKPMLRSHPIRLADAFQFNKEVFVR